MIMRKILTLWTLLFVCLLKIAAQNKAGIISGSMLDAGNNPLSSVSVSLLKAKDSSLVKLAVTGKNGKYEFENIAGGNYIILATSVGYEKSMSKVFELR